MLVLAIDSAADVAGVALFDDELLLAEATWRSRQSQSRQLLPTIDWLLQRCGRDKTDVGAIVVCLGPGSYAGLRVGLSTAKGLAFGLEVPIVGIGRLAADALPFAAATAGRVVAVHAAGRAELAWAIYQGLEGGIEELAAPRLGRTEDLVSGLDGGDVVCGEIASLAAELTAEATERGCRVVKASAMRVVSVGQLGWQRIALGEFDNPDTLVPLYLRAPAIGPQPPR